MTTKDGRPTLYAVRRALEDSERIVYATAVMQAVRNSPLARLTPYMPDAEYRVCTADAIRKYLAWSTVDRKIYRAEHFDCDDFAASLRGEARRKCGLNSIAEVWDISGKHAYSVAVVYDPTDTGEGEAAALRIMVIEPQSDRIVLQAGQLKQYKAESGIIIF